MTSILSILEKVAIFLLPTNYANYHEFLFIKIKYDFQDILYIMYINSYNSINS